MAHSWSTGKKAAIAHPDTYGVTCYPWTEYTAVEESSFELVFRHEEQVRGRHSM